MKSIRFTTDELNEEVLDLIRRAVPTVNNRITKEHLSMRIFGVVTQTTTRKIRDAVNELRKQGYPIISTTDKTPGYWYDGKDIGVIIGDYESRIVDMSATIRALKRGPGERNIKPVQIGLGW